MNDTPRTDGHLLPSGDDLERVFADFARGLERETRDLAEALTDLLETVEMSHKYPTVTDARNALYHQMEVARIVLDNYNGPPLPEGEPIVCPEYRDFSS